MKDIEKMDIVALVLSVAAIAINIVAMIMRALIG